MNPSTDMDAEYRTLLIDFMLSYARLPGNAAAARLLVSLA